MSSTTTPRAGPAPVLRIESVIPVKTPGEMCPLWSAPAGASVLWVMTRRALSLPLQAASTSGLSSRLTARAFAIFLSDFGAIGILQRKRDPAFAQQSRQQAHRHPNDVVIGPADRSDQPVALALYSVGTRLILRFPRPYVRVDHAGCKFTHRDIRARDPMGLTSRASVDQVNRGVDLVPSSRERSQEGGGLAAVVGFPVDAAIAAHLRIRGDHDRPRRPARDRVRFRGCGPGHVAQRSE